MKQERNHARFQSYGHDVNEDENDFDWMRMHRQRTGQDEHRIGSQEPASQ